MIDFAKAFDTLNWDSIAIMLEALAFNGIFRELVMI